jgi:hypothetical protein
LLLSIGPNEVEGVVSETEYKGGWEKQVFGWVGII